MIRLTLLLLLLCCAAEAAAPEFSVGIGMNQASPVMDGFWYDEGLQHRLNFTTLSWRADVSQLVSSRWSLRLAVVSTGIDRSDAVAVVPDASYDNKNHICIAKPCAPLFRFVGAFRASGLSGSAEYRPEAYILRPVAFGAGLYVFRPQQRITTYGVTNPHENVGFYESSGSPHVGPTISAMSVFGRFALRLDYYLLCVDNRCKSEIIPQGIARSMTMVSVVGRL